MAASLSQRSDQLAALIVDRAFAAEVVVMLGDLEQAVARDVPATRDVLKEREDVFGSLGSTE